jgi:hypothetical protein
MALAEEFDEIQRLLGGSLWKLQTALIDRFGQRHLFSSRYTVCAGVWSAIGAPD